MRSMVAVLVIAGCASEGGDADETSSGSGASDDVGTTGDCGELPLCDLCPDEGSALCGMPCPTSGQACSNQIGDGMQCEGGLWTCSVHPPLGTGCNDVCGLEDACSEIGCSSGLTAVLVAGAGTFVPGVYELATLADGEAAECTFTISDDLEQCAKQPCVSDSTCNAYYLLTENPPSIELVFGVVASLELTLTREGVEVAHEQVLPAYGVSAPNGSGCGPACAQANVEIVVR